MSYCPYCGAALMEGARFCSACGGNVIQASAVTQTIVNPVTATLPSTALYSGEGYGVMLVDCGICAISTAADLISDACGYTDADAMRLASNAPTWIAQNLTENQAAYLAQCLTEYGAQAAIYDRFGNKTLLSDVDSVFDGAGSFLSKVASAFRLIGIGNRITQAIRRLTLPARPAVYTMPRPAPRPPVRRHAIQHPAPMAPVKPQPASVPRQNHAARQNVRQPVHGVQGKPPVQRANHPQNSAEGRQPEHWEGSHGGPGGDIHRKV